MNFHWPSFLLGYGAGIASTLVAQRLRPVLTELASAGFEMFEAAAAKLAMSREDIDDILAEAKARARGHEEAPEPARPQQSRGKSKPRKNRRTRPTNGAAPAGA